MVDSKWRLVGDEGLGVGTPDGRGGRCPWLVLGRLLLRDDVGGDEEAGGLSGRKKLDLRLRGAGEGGIWDRVSIVLSDSEGLGRLEAVCDLAGSSGCILSISPATRVSNVCDLLVAAF